MRYGRLGCSAVVVNRGVASSSRVRCADVLRLRSVFGGSVLHQVRLVLLETLRPFSGGWRGYRPLEDVAAQEELVEDFEAQTARLGRRPRRLPGHRARRRRRPARPPSATAGTSRTPAEADRAPGGTPSWRPSPSEFPTNEVTFGLVTPASEPLQHPPSRIPRRHHSIWCRLVLLAPSPRGGSRDRGMLLSAMLHTDFRKCSFHAVG